MSSRNTSGAGMRDAEGAGGKQRPPPWRDKADTRPRSAPLSEKLSEGALPLPSPRSDFAPPRCPAAAQTLRPGRATGGRVRWWALLALLALLPCASAPTAMPLCVSHAAPVTLLAVASSALAIVPGLLSSLESAARASRLFSFGAVVCWRILDAGVLGSKPRTWPGPSKAHRWQQLLLTTFCLSMLSGAQAQTDTRMYTRLACPTVKHRWLAASQYLNATTWTDGVQSGAQDAILVNTDTGTPSISKPFYDQSSKSVLFSPRSMSSTTGPYVNLQSVHFGTGDFTFVVLAKYSNAPNPVTGANDWRWPRIFDFSTTGNQYGTYFILTEVRETSRPARIGATRVR